MNISFNPQVVKVTAQPPGLRAQAAAAGEDVIITPQTLAVSALSSALGVNIQNPVGREVIQGLDYESGEWKPEEDTTVATIPFSKPHDEPPMLFVVITNVKVDYDKKTVYGNEFINFNKMFGHSFPKASGLSPYYKESYGDAIRYSTGNDTSYFITGATEVMRQDELATFCTNEAITLNQTSSGLYYRASITYEWFAVWANNE